MSTENDLIVAQETIKHLEEENENLNKMLNQERLAENLTLEMVIRGKLTELNKEIRDLEVRRSTLRLTGVTGIGISLSINKIHNEVKLLEALLKEAGLQ